jgi:hypothetical protein
MFRGLKHPPTVRNYSPKDITYDNRRDNCDDTTHQNKQKKLKLDGWMYCTLFNTTITTAVVI